MILHRLRLSNFRGIDEREIAFPDRGVVVVCGANEIGKSSMIEALDLLLNYKDRSGHKDVKAVKPTHADVGAEVEAEISAGPYRFVYRKRFHRKPKTELRMVEPVRRSLDGDEAHDQVLAMLGETVDMKLWHAQQVLQAASTSAVDLSGCDALSRALDVAAGDHAARSGSEPLLIERIDAEFGRYFTPTGRPTGPWAAAIDALTDAERERERCVAAMADVDERVSRHAELSAELSGLATARQAAAERCDAARGAAAALSVLAEELAAAQRVAETARAKAAASAAAAAERSRLCADAVRRTAALAELQAGLAAAVEDQVIADEVAEAATAAATESAAALVAAQDRVDAARCAMDGLAAREEAQRLAARVERIDQTRRDLAPITERLGTITLTAELLLAIEEAAASVERLDAQLHAVAATLEFTALEGRHVLVDGEQVALDPGAPWTIPASVAATIELPGVLEIRINPGSSMAGLRTELHAAQQRRDETLMQGGVDDLAAARRVGQERLTLAAKRDKLSAVLDELCAGDDVDRLRARLSELQATVAEPAVDAESARVELSSATGALTQARQADATVQQLSRAASTRLAEKITAAKVLLSGVGTAAAELELAGEQLAAGRAIDPDDAISARAAEDTENKQRADIVVTQLVERYGRADPETVKAELAAATQSVDECERNFVQTRQALNDLTVELAVIGSEGRKGKLDDAEILSAHARAEHARVGKRAGAAKLLRCTMNRHRDNTRQRYVAPYRTEVERLGRTVFGPTFEVEVDTNLTILRRTLDDRTVPYDSLSGGAKEQLGILARLAGAALVATEDTVPVVIDDALGFSDPQRLGKMAAVFNTVGRDGQVIVLTCMPGRYDGIDGAHVIELTG
jgi:hypothetical protein